MKRKLILHGSLRKLWPEGFIVLEADTVAEAVSGLCKVTGGAFNPLPGHGKREIQVLGYDTEKLVKGRLSDDVEELHLVPSLRGGKKGGTLQIVIGVIMIAVAAYMGFGVEGAKGMAEPMLGSITTAGQVMFAGVMMLAGGVLAMLSPSPKMDMPGFTTDTNPDASKYLGGFRDTVKVGTRIPIIAGRSKAGMHILSLNIDSRDVAV